MYNVRISEIILMPFQVMGLKMLTYYYSLTYSQKGSCHVAHARPGICNSPASASQALGPEALISVD